MKIIPAEIVQKVKDWGLSLIGGLNGKGSRSTGKSRMLANSNSTENAQIKGEYATDPDANPSLFDDIGYIIIICVAFILVLVVVIGLIALSKRYKK